MLPHSQRLNSILKVKMPAVCRRPPSHNLLRVIINSKFVSILDRQHKESIGIQWWLAMVGCAQAGVDWVVLLPCALQVNTILC
jgi:hypothetical protein